MSVETEHSPAVLKMLKFQSMIIGLVQSGKATLDRNGHFCRPTCDFDVWDGDHVKRKFEFYLHDVLTPHCSFEERDALHAALETGSKLPEFVTIKKSCYQPCDECGERFDIETDGQTFRMTPPCSTPNGYQPYKVRVSFPSGKMVVANDLRGCFPRIPKEYDPEIPRADKLKWDINSHRGCQTVAEFCAKNGWLHFMVGNTSPSVYKRKGEIIISVPGYNEDATDDKDEYIHIEGRKVADICTDLWWVSLADYDLVMHNLSKGIGDPKRRPKKIEELLKDPKALAEEMYWKVVPVAKGEYEFEIPPCLPIIEHDKPFTYGTGKLLKKQGKK